MSRPHLVGVLCSKWQRMRRSSKMTISLTTRHVIRPLTSKYGGFLSLALLLRDPTTKPLKQKKTPEICNDLLGVF